MDERGDAKHGDDQINLGKIIGKNHKYALTVNNETAEDASVRHKNEMAKDGLCAILFRSFRSGYHFYGLYLYLRYRNDR
ncbi:hypothetical protein SAMN05216339_1292 [Nitrosomonas eutropha]|uniref:Uncharacterized protein n=1 Tax=Nitrosomonas eutropha TaxID=916 RepID=A0A1I7JHM0_9PROT|nr:hypothetical protein SAMN05216339_1292 [Nitrosomonas eutropha]